MTCADRVTGVADIDEEERDQRNMLRDNSVSCLGKIVLFQNDMQGPVTAELTVEFFNLLPIKNDIDEAQDLHKTLFEQIIKGNPVI